MYIIEVEKLLREDVKMDEPFITCKYDRAFKEIFLKEENKDLLIGLLETCLGYKIEEVEILNSEVLERNINVKRKVLDVLLNNGNERINVEINTNTDEYVIERNIAYLCNVHSQNVLRGESYRSNKKSIQINLSYGIKEDYFVKRYLLSDEETGEVLSKNLILYIFNMDKIKDIWYSKNEKLIDKYKYLIMLDLGKKDLEDLALLDKKVGKYNMELKSVNVSVGINDWISEEEDKRRWKNTYIQEGYEEGIEQGIEQGIEKKQREMIINLNSLDTPIEVIAKASNLSVEKVKEILDKPKDTQQ